MKSGTDTATAASGSDVVFSYQPKVRVVFALMAFLAMALPGLFIAAFNFDGTFQLRAIQREGVPALIALGLLFAFEFFLIFICFRLNAMRTDDQSKLVLAQDSLTLPKSVWSSQKVTIQYAAIDDVTLKKTRYATVIELRYADKQQVIDGAFVPKDGSLSAIFDMIQQRVKAQTDPIAQSN